MLDFFDEIEDNAVESERRDVTQDDFNKECPDLNFDKAKSMYYFLVKNKNERNKSEQNKEKLDGILGEIISLIPKDYFDNDVKPENFKFVQYQSSSSKVLSSFFVVRFYAS